MVQLGRKDTGDDSLGAAAEGFLLSTRSWLVGSIVVVVVIGVAELFPGSGGAGVSGSRRKPFLKVYSKSSPTHLRIVIIFVVEFELADIVMVVGILHDCPLINRVVGFFFGMVVP